MREFFARLAKLERQPPPPTTWDAVRVSALEHVPIGILRGFARNQVLAIAFRCLTPTEQATYSTTHDDDAADALLTLGHMRLSEFFLDLIEPDDDDGVSQWYHNWDSRKSWTPPQ